MKKRYTILMMFLVSVTIMVTVNFALTGAADLTSEDKAAFIVRDEWTAWETAFKASLNELDKNATSRIFSDMDYYDMQYRFTEKYKTKEYLDDDGKPTELLQKLIKEARKKRNKEKAQKKIGG